MTNPAADRAAADLAAVDLAAVDALAEDAHRGQTRRHGTPYIDHPRAVSQLVDELARACDLTIDDSVRAAALLHDVLEDSDTSADTLRARFGDDVARRVTLLTKTGKGEDATVRYYADLMRAGADSGDVALALIKVADRCHNLAELHKAPSLDKLRSYVDETRRFVMPLARAHPGLQRAVTNAMKTALRAQGAPLPHDLAPPAGRVGRGIYAVLTPEDDVDVLALRVRALCQAGVALVQLRAKDKDDRFIVDALAVVLHECDRFSVPVIVNDRADLCVATGADGVHVGQTDVPAALARRVVGKDALVGTSSHTRAQADAADDDDSNDYVALGPIYASPTKQGHASIVSTLGLADIATRMKRPLVAIGGITDPVRVIEVTRAGAQLAAVVSALEGRDLHAVHLMARRMGLAFAAADSNARGAA